MGPAPVLVQLAAVQRTACSATDHKHIHFACTLADIHYMHCMHYIHTPCAVNSASRLQTAPLVMVAMVVLQQATVLIPATCGWASYALNSTKHCRIS